MTAITWTRVPRNGFVNSYWCGSVDGVPKWKIDQRKPAGASRQHNTRIACLFRLPYGHIGTFPNVTKAKAEARRLTEEAK